MTKPTEHPPQSNKPDTPPGQEADPGLGQEGAPGQNKPKPDQELPEEPEAQPKA